MRKIIVIIFVFAPIAFSCIARAAVMTVLPPDAAERVVIVLDTQGEAVNAVEGHFAFDPEKFSIEAIDDGGSVVDLWIAPPAYSNETGSVDFSGIIPGGIATARGTIATIIIVPKLTGTFSGFSLITARALLNDGQGTAAKLSVISDPFLLVPPAIVASSGASSTTDTRAPDPFLPEIASDPNLFGGKYFLAFGATDQRSGIDHYEVQEGANGAWQRAASPYLLYDQSLASDIFVRAFDRAGNFRTVKVAAPRTAAVRSTEAFRGLLPWSGAILLLISLWLFLRRRTGKRT